MSNLPADITLGVLSPMLGGFYFGGLLTGIQAQAERQGAQVLAVQTGGETFGHLSNYELPVGWDLVDGWLLVPGALSMELLLQLKASGKPLVTLSMIVPELGAPSVLPDNRGGVVAAVRHLAEHGHRRIAFVGLLDQEDMRQRYQGYQQGLAESGLPLDPALLVTASNHIEEGGRDAARHIVEQGLDCTAAICATDLNAIGLLEELQAQGWRLPRDMAIVGFDDIERTQYLRPSLSSIRQQFDALGSRAAELLIARLAGDDVPAESHYVETFLVRRHSCGCGLELVDDIAAAPALRAAELDLLAQQMVAVALQPFTPPAGSRPTDIWPGVAALLGELQAALVGAEPPPADAIVQAWTEVMQLAPNQLERINQIFSLLEDAGEGLASSGADAQVRRRLRAYLKQMRLEMMRAWQAFERDRRQHLDTAIEINYRLNLHLNLHLNSRELDWLRLTSLSLGCLGLWPDSHAGAQREVEIAGVYGDGAVLQELIARREDPRHFPPREFLQAARAYPGTITTIIPLRTPTHDWGLLALTGPVETKVLGGLGSMTQWSGMLSTALEREQLLFSLERQQQLLHVVNEDLREAKDTAEEANRAKSQFLTNMSHELRTPLNAILNFTKLMGREPFGTLTEQQRDFHQRVLNNAEHLLGLINDILDLAKVEAGKMELEPEVLDLRPIFHGVMSTAIGLTAGKGLALEVDVPEDLPLVWGDKLRVRQILINLLSNAAKFTRQGMIALTARAREEGYIEIAVRDTGIGIAPEHRERIFAEFQQIQSEMSREYQGTGLGLPICRRLVEMHGGTMWLESELGAGSTFYFTLPSTDQAPPE